MYLTLVLRARRYFFVSRGVVCAMPDEYVTGFFLSAQLVVETVEESVRWSASWVF